MKKEKVTLGITALCFLRAQIDKRYYDLDVGLRFIKGAEALIIWSVRPLKSYMIWVQTGVSQVGFYPQNIYCYSTKGPSNKIKF